MLEFIVLDVGRREDVISEDRESNSIAELQATLDDCADSFLELLERSQQG